VLLQYKESKPMLKWLLSFFLLFGLIFTIFNCTKRATTGGIRPSPVVLIPGTADTCFAEKGLDAVPERDAIRIEWIPSSEDAVTGYELYRSSEKEGPYSLIARLVITDSFFVDLGVSLYQRYYYYIEAVTDEGLKSDPSDTLDYKLIKKATGLDPVGKASNPRPVFSWENPDPYAAPCYIIRLIEAASGRYIWLHVVPSHYNKRESVDFNIDGSAVLDSLAKGVDYQWRVDIRGPEEHCGSESNWVAFRVQ